MLTIINYGLGNLNSVLNLCKRIGVEAQITGDLKEIEKAEKLILPGVGNFEQGMKNLHALQMTDLLHFKAKEQKTLVLGICMGAQLMTRRSEEGSELGLAWVDADTVRFKTKDFPKMKVPHLTWAEIKLLKASPLTNNLPENPRFYFAHSFHFEFFNPDQVIATATYGYDFAAIFEHENIFGAQFHPEKSHKFGMKLIENFAKL